MDTARVLAAQGAPHGTTVTALQQLGGRGRHGRAWVSAPRAGLWLSTLLCPPPNAPLSGLTLCMGAAVLCAVHALGGHTARIKWPNDIVVQDRKLAGILTERVEGPLGPQVLVGVGLNLAVNAPQELQRSDPEAASRYVGLGSLCPGVKLEAVRHGVIQALEAAYTAWCDNGMGPTLEVFARYHALLGLQVRAHNAQGHGTVGEVTGIAQDGGLQLLCAGELVTVYAGEVTRVRPLRP